VGTNTDTLNCGANYGLNVYGACVGNASVSS